MIFLSSLFNTFLFSGKSPIAPGTVGSFAALVFCFFFLPSYELKLVFIFSFTLLSYITISYELKASKEQDPQHIVIDEVIGMWIALLFMPSNNISYMVLAFIIFRFLDILKPSIINRIQNIKGAFGILLDDMACGFITSIILLGIVSL